MLMDLGMSRTVIRATLFFMLVAAILSCPMASGAQLSPTGFIVVAQGGSTAARSASTPSRLPAPARMDRGRQDLQKNQVPETWPSVVRPVPQAAAAALPASGQRTDGGTACMGAGTSSSMRTARRVMLAESLGNGPAREIISLWIGRIGRMAKGPFRPMAKPSLMTGEAQ